MVEAQAEAMKSAAANSNAGPVMAFAGLNMAEKAGGINTQTLFQMAEEDKNKEVQPKNVEEWKCSCGATNTGKFCTECGAKKPATYKCNKCGWEPQDKTVPPKFCPNCGDAFDENDAQ